MKTTQEQVDKEGSDFSNAFNESETAKPEVSEDEAFGISPEIPDAAASEGTPPAVTIEVGASPDAAGEAAETPAEENAETPAQESAEQANGEEAPMSQNEKTWEGRLRKREQELQAREQAIADREKEGNGTASGAEAGAADNTEAGADNPDGKSKMSPEDAMKQLADDYGPDFVEMINVIATDKAEKAAAAIASNTVGEVSQKVQDIIAHINDEDQRNHFEKIADAHPDFMDVHDSKEFQDWIAASPKKDEYMQILEKGNAKQIIALLKEFKDSKESGQDEAAETDAEGVRSSSGGIKLPEGPATGKDDYEAAWEHA